jgi:branched-chain amino acid transport system substrate-binding protein
MKAAVGDSAIENSIVFTNGDPDGSHPEARLYRAVMDQYAPGVDESGVTSIGYQSMLGFIRAVNATGLPDAGSCRGPVRSPG